MYLLYLDDSGSVKNTSESYFVLGGVCLHEDKVFYINQYLDRLASRFDQETPSNIEFHASEIFSGRSSPWDKHSREGRIKVIKDVLHVVNHEARNSCVFSCAVHKSCFQGRDPVEIAFEDICSRFNMFLDRLYHKKNEAHRGLIILDESSYETTLQRMAKNFRTDGTRWGVTNNLQEVPLFVDSKASRAIQLADHIAYAVFRRYNASDINYFNVIQGQFDSDGGRLHGLAHKQFYDESCTCPSCLTRKISTRDTAQSQGSLDL